MVVYVRFGAYPDKIISIYDANPAALAVRSHKNRCIHVHCSSVRVHRIVPHVSSVKE